MEKKRDFTEFDARVEQAVLLLSEMGLNTDAIILQRLRHVITYRAHENIPGFDTEEKQVDYLYSLNTVNAYIDENGARTKNCSCFDNYIDAHKQFQELNR